MEKRNQISLRNENFITNNLLKLKKHLKYDLVLSLKMDSIKRTFTALRNRESNQQFLRLIDFFLDQESLTFSIKNIQICKDYILN
jgi:hypothetical protein